jgi:regulator of nucleoside diphosphate kinase
VIVPPEEIPADVITMNSCVRLRDLEKGTTVEYTLVYPTEANFSEGKISVVAPIGAAMIGYRLGDEIEWDVPAGRRRFRVEAVLYQPEAAGDTHL